MSCWTEWGSLTASQAGDSGSCRVRTCLRSGSQLSWGLEPRGAASAKPMPRKGRNGKCGMGRSSKTTWDCYDVLCLHSLHQGCSKHSTLFPMFPWEACFIVSNYCLSKAQLQPFQRWAKDNYLTCPILRELASIILLKGLVRNPAGWTLSTPVGALILLSAFIIVPPGTSQLVLMMFAFREDFPVFRSRVSSGFLPTCSLLIPGTKHLLFFLLWGCFQNGTKYILQQEKDPWARNH